MNFDTVRKNLEALGYAVSCFQTAEEAVAYLDRQIDGVTVGIGGSMTVEEMGLYSRLACHNDVYWHQHPPKGSTGQEIRDAASAAEVYISSVNALAQTGEIVNIDGMCNRVASVLYGHGRVYLVVGKNKLAEDYDSAVWRARNVAAPKNARRLGRNTPCAVKADRCYNCKSPERICRALTVLWSKPMASSYEVVLIDEELGY